MTSSPPTRLAVGLGKKKCPRGSFSTSRFAPCSMKALRRTLVPPCDSLLQANRFGDKFSTINNIAPVFRLRKRFFEKFSLCRKQMVKHQINDDAGRRNIEPNRVSVFDDAAMSNELPGDGIEHRPQNERQNDER